MKNVWDVYDEIFRDDFPKLRRSQEEILLNYEKVRDDSRIIEIEAPPGTGKSLINMIIALAEEDNWKNVYDKIVISSYTKALQYQYLDTFYDVLRKHNISCAAGLGVQSFTCKRFNKQISCCIATLGFGCKFLPKIEEGSHKELLKLLVEDPNTVFFGFWLPYALKNPNVKVKALRSNISCEYWENEYIVFSSKVIFTNHHYLISHLFLNESLPIPSVLVIDEAHNFPEIVAESLKLYIGEHLLSFLIKNKIINSKSDIVVNSEDYQGFQNFVEFIQHIKDDLYSHMNSTKGTLRLYLMDLLGLTKVYKLIIDYAIQRDEPLSKYFTIETGDSYIAVTPTYYAYFAILDYLSTFVKHKIILSSATLPPKEKTPGEVRLYSDKDMYDPKQRPVVYLEDIPNITNRTISKPQVQQYILNLIRTLWNFKNFRRIVIHSINNFIRDYLGSILDEMGYPVIMTENLKEDLDKWMKMPEGIIISAGLEEGVDLKYDIARVQIVIKVPTFDTRKDPFMRWLLKNDKMMYNYYVARRMVQIAGRICRARDDAGLTIVLDRRALEHLKKYYHLYPTYYRKAVRIMTTPMLLMLLQDFNLFIKEIKRKQKITGYRDVSLDELGVEMRIKSIAWSIKSHFKEEKNNK